MSTLHKLLLILGLVACSEESAYFTYTPDYKFTKITTPEMAIINHLNIKRDTLPIKYAKPDSTTYLKVYSGFAIEKNNTYIVTDTNYIKQEEPYIILQWINK